MPRVKLRVRPSDLEGPLAFVLPFVAYLWVGWRLGIDMHLLPGDSLARVANASSAVFSRDPHPESIGFVWSPFPSLLEVPLVWLAHLWPALLDRGMAGVIISSLAMAGMVEGEARKTGRSDPEQRLPDLRKGVPRRVRHIRRRRAVARPSQG